MNKKVTALKMRCYQLVSGWKFRTDIEKRTIYAYCWYARRFIYNELRSTNWKHDLFIYLDTLQWFESLGIGQWIKRKPKNHG